MLGSDLHISDVSDADLARWEAAEVSPPLIPSVSTSTVGRTAHHELVGASSQCSMVSSRLSLQCPSQCSKVPSRLSLRRASIMDSGPKLRVRVASLPVGETVTHELDDMVKSVEQGAQSSSVLPNQSTLRKDVDLLNSRLHSTNALLLNPNGKRMQYWDLCTLSALAFTATVTPYEVCMMWGPSKVGALFVINQCINFIFIVDICCNFFLPFKAPLSHGGGWVKDHTRIAAHYAKGWFVIDVCSVFPVDVLMVAGVLGSEEIGSDNGNNGTQMLQMVRMLRLLRLIKLARILRASRIFSRWENSISISYPQRSLITWTVLIAMVLHWMACSLGLVAQLHTSLRTPSVTAEVSARIEAERQGLTTTGSECFGCVYGDHFGMARYCESPCLTPCEFDVHAGLDLPNAYPAELDAHMNYLVKQESWVCRYNAVGTVRPSQYHGSLWVAAIYVSLLQLSGGVGSIVPENLEEYVLFIINILLGSVLWAMVVGTVCGVMTTGDPHSIKFKQDMDALNFFLEDMNMPSQLRMRAREYLRNCRERVDST
uniref:Ion transport domain-containing protein n=1 Tax=Haptolina brevifila TaxID=156173 RepID=A0A7S2CQW0_9EUKA|mmetsp:Transcript_26900/g.54048  ORF Transcript_26900/g.54048 Transcript_26900/m.54048 type:complete len:542 (+) Transcript_26900:17-1642(+)